MRDFNEPEQGDRIAHVNDLGEPNGRTSKVRNIISDDRHGLFEVIDNFNTVRIIRRLDDDTWLETFID